MRTALAMIYVLVDPRTDAVRYVGWTVDPNKRLAAHLKETETGGQSHKCRWIGQLIRLGLKPRMEVLEEVARGEARSREIITARSLREAGARLTNGSPGGDLEPWGWNLGLTKASDARVARAAAALRARMMGNQHGLGRKHTDAAREKMRAAQLRSWAENPDRRSVWSRHRHPGFGRKPWTTGLTKDTDERLANAAKKSSVSHRGKIPWNKGQTSRLAGSAA